MEGLVSVTQESGPGVESLLERARKGDRLAFEQIVGRVEQSVLRTAAFLTRNWDDAQDVAQEVYVRIIQKAPAVRRWENLQGWVYRVTVNVARDWQRKRRFWVPLKDLTAWVAPSRQLESREVRGRLARALGTLSFMERAAFILRELQELPAAEVARILGCQPATVRGYLFSARQKLQRHFQDFREEK